MRPVELSELDDKLCIRHAAKIYFRIKKPYPLPKTFLVDEYTVEVRVDPDTILVVESVGDAVYSHFRNPRSGKRSTTVNNPALAVLTYKRGITYAI